jgi:hypothetical protein
VLEVPPGRIDVEIHRQKIASRTEADSAADAGMVLGARKGGSTTLLYLS